MSEEITCEYIKQLKKTTENNISHALLDSYFLTREYAKKNWRHLKAIKQHVNVCRGLVNMHDMAKAPEKYYLAGMKIQQEKILECAIHCGVKDIENLCRLFPAGRLVISNYASSAVKNSGVLFVFAYEKLWDAIVDWRHVEKFEDRNMISTAKKIKEISRHIHNMKQKNIFAMLVDVHRTKNW
ncbi:MAG: hypothetical protein MJ187_00125 [Alphaproteobacteria bacterium]|nr:hypothetical protein [Alphaproteobacteria bacterium]